ncbi:hypothetical protein C1646_170073 [Rhizophagus diaphanus]|nr:hypothetical protein C1646_170073 [Rhizophagus diaphanus] [Rhizophagus sp. MUCL 43196]
MMNSSLVSATAKFSFVTATLYKSFHRNKLDLNTLKIAIFPNIVPGSLLIVVTKNFRPVQMVSLCQINFS